MTTLFNEQFFTDSWDEDMITYITSKGWKVTSERTDDAILTNEHLLYGTGNDHFWSSDYEVAEILGAGYKQLTKEEFKEKIGMITVQKKLKPSDVKGYVLGEHQPYTNYNQEIADWLVVNANVEYDAYFCAFNKFIFTGTHVFYTHNYVYSYEVYYTNDEYKKLIGMDDTPDGEFESLLKQAHCLVKQIELLWDKAKSQIDAKQENIRKELEFAEAKKARLEKHIDVLKSKLQ